MLDYNPIPTPGEVDVELADYSDQDLERAIERAGALPADRWEHLTAEQRTAQRAINALVGRKLQRRTLADEAAQAQRAAAVRADFDKQRAARLSAKRADYDTTI